MGNFADDRSDGIRRSEVVNGLGEGDEDGGNPQLFVGEEFDDVGVEAQDTEFVVSHDAR